jgi:hypothetical protein
MIEELEEQPQNFWNARYERGETGWDIGYPSPYLKQILDSYSNREAQILIPGAGNAWEARYAWENGYANLYVIDIAPLAVESLKRACPEHQHRILLGDFFAHTGTYDLILEQTFFCALHPNLRVHYARKMAELLSPKGSVEGLLFATAMNSDRPPFGGNEAEYKALFSNHFRSVEIRPCDNSIPARAQNELSIKLSEPIR